MYINLVRLACAFAKLPDIENTNFHAGFISRIREILEPICMDMALILRLFKLQISVPNGEMNTLSFLSR